MKDLELLKASIEAAIESNKEALDSIDHKAVKEYFLGKNDAYHALLRIVNYKIEESICMGQTERNDNYLS